jgi:hypothetical protein
MFFLLELMFSLVAAQPALDQQPLLIQDRMGDRNRMGVDAFEVAQDVEMQR